MLNIFLFISMIDCLAQDKFAEAEEALSKGKLDEAIQSYGEFLESDSTHIPSLLGIARAFSEKKQIGQDKGVVVSRIFPGPAADAGIRRGDILDKIQFQSISNIKDYERITKTLKKGSTINIRYIRDKNATFVPLKIPK